MKVIASEEQAERIGKQTGQPFTVFWYQHQKDKLTLFGIEIKATGETITHV